MKWLFESNYVYRAAWVAGVLGGLALSTVFICDLLKSRASSAEVSEVSNSVGKFYLESNRDSIIKNWQAKVSSTPSCVQFKERFKDAGGRYDNAANGMFVQDMTKVWDATKAAGCAASV
jgi:hypothetical protein